MKKELKDNVKEVVNDLLGYEGLKIIQRPDAFNFSLDSTLLADFVTINLNDKKIIDLGCGNGYIPIFLTLRTKSNEIYGTEIQKDIYDLAKRSVEINNLESRVHILNEDMKNLPTLCGNSSFDVITCNPPYFKYKETSNINKNDYLTIARHEITITLEEVLQTVQKLLKDGGTFAMVHRTERMIDVIEAFRKNGIEPKKLRFVYPKKSSTTSMMILIEGKKSKNQGGLKVLPPLYVYNQNGKYTKEVLRIFNYQEDTYVKTTELSK